MKINEIIAKAVNNFANNVDKWLKKTPSTEDSFIALVSSNVDDYNLVRNLVIRLRYLKEDRLLDEEDYASIANVAAQVIKNSVFTFEDFERIEITLCTFNQIIDKDKIQILKSGGRISFANSDYAAKFLISIFDKVLLWI